MYSRYESGHVTNTRHETDNHGPAEIGAMQGGWLVDDGADALGLDDAPNEKDNASNGSHY